MKVKYVVRENGKFAVKDEKFLPAIRTFDSEEEALKFLKEEFNNAEEKFEIQVQQENGEFRAFEVPTESGETTLEETPTPEVTPEVAPETTDEVAPEVTPEVAPETTPEAVVVPEVVTAPEAAPEVAPEATTEVTPEVVAADAMPEAAPEVQAEAGPEVVVATAEPGVETATGVQAVETPETMNIEETKAEGSADAKAKFDIKDIWKNPEYRKWLYLGIAVFIEVAIIIAIIILIAG